MDSDGIEKTRCRETERETERQREALIIELVQKSIIIGQRRLKGCDSQTY